MVLTFKFGFIGGFLREPSPAGKAKNEETQQPDKPQFEKRPVPLWDAVLDGIVS